MANRRKYRWRGFGAEAAMPEKRWDKVQKNRARRPDGVTVRYDPSIVMKMTPSQARYLKHLSDRAGVKFDSTLDKTDASVRIAELLAILDGKLERF